MKRLEGRKDRKYFIIGKCVSVPGSIPGGPTKKALAVTRCNGIILKMFLGFLASTCRTAFSGENRSKAFEMVVTVWTSF